jgi:3-oxoacyl-[acyl-carrier protein] reductase
VAIVTNVSRGIERAIASHLSALGASLILGYTSSVVEAESLAAELPRAVAVRTDVSDESVMRSLFDAAECAFDAVHIVVANSGVLDAAYLSVMGTTATSFDRIVVMNMRGAVLVRPQGSEPPPPQIVVVTSSVVGSHPTGYAAYMKSKMAVEALVRTLTNDTHDSAASARAVMAVLAEGSGEEDEGHT